MQIAEVQAAIQNCAELTECNNHTEAYIAGCELLLDSNPALEETINRLRNIQFQQDRLGYMTGDLIDKRFKLYQEMIRASKYTFSAHPDLQEAFYQAF